jgi:threonyl-tRNA synthetase
MSNTTSPQTPESTIKNPSSSVASTHLPNSIDDFKEPEIHSPLETMRHSCAHIMAHAISNLWPQAKFGIGPTIENGFYYDIDLDIKLTPEDLPKIEKEMSKIIAQKQTFVRSEHSIDEALKFFEKSSQTYKLEIIRTLQANGETRVSS